MHKQSSKFTRKESTSEGKMPSQKFKYRRKKLLTRAYGIWPSKAIIFALVAKRDFATIPTKIDNLQGKSTVVIEQICLHKYI